MMKTRKQLLEAAKPYRLFQDGYSRRVDEAAYDLSDCMKRCDEDDARIAEQNLRDALAIREAATS
jgi:hypothetical protein